MIKFFTLTLAAVLSIGTMNISAQQNQLKKGTFQEETKKLKKAVVLTPLQTVNNSKKRSGSRLIAESSLWGMSLSELDSSRYEYLSNYGYDPTASVTLNEYDLSYNGEMLMDYVDFFDKSKRWSKVGASMILQDSGIATFTTGHKIASYEYREVNPGNYYSKTSFTYNAAGYRTQWLDSSIGGNGTEVFRLDIDYNAQNNAIKFTSYEKNGAMWDLVSKDTFIYDGNGRVAESISYDYDALTSTWQESYKDVISYTANSKIQSISTQTWNNGWENSNQNIRIYDAANRVVSVVNFYWNMNIWEPSNKDSFDYNAPIYPHTSTQYFWNGSNWEPTFRKNYTYNASNQVIKDTQSNYDINTSTWSISAINTYYYESFTPATVSSLQTIDGNITLYPVPTMDMLHVKFDLKQAQDIQYSILTLQGQVLKQGNLSQVVNQTLSVPVADLSSGMYILRMEISNGSESIRFVK